MSDDFEGREYITLRPGASKVARTFAIEVCSSATANDGRIPYGRTVASVVVTAYSSSNTVVTTELIYGTPSVAANVVTIRFNYPSTTGVGFYEIKILATLDDGSTIDSLYFEKIHAVNEQA